MTDPFQSAATATITPAGDPFAQPASSLFPKFEQLEGRLLMIKPSSIELVAKPEKFGGKPGETQERITADMIVLDGGEIIGEQAPTKFADQYITQQSIVGALKGCLKPGSLPAVLGRLFRFPMKADAAKYPDRHALAKARTEWRAIIASGGNAPEPGFTWKLEFHNEGSDVEAAREWLKTNTL